MKRIMLGLGLVTLVAGCTPEETVAPSEESGETLYAAYCAGCHGANATGGIEVGSKRAADLTTLAARNDGTFPTAYVMSTIDGYARRDTHGPMPEFGALIESPMESWTDERGVPTPTPHALVALAEYLEGLQG